MESLISENGNSAANDLPLNTLIEGLSFERYCAIDAMNSSGMKVILRSCAHYQELRVSAAFDPNTAALRFGRIFHAAILESERFLDTYLVKPKFDRRTKEGKRLDDEFEAALKPGAIVVPEGEIDMLVGMARKVRAHPICRQLLKNGVRETTLVTIDPETGERIKIRPDFVTSEDAIVVDLKSTIDGRLREFGLAALRWDYDLQAQSYLHAMKTAGLSSGRDFVFFAVEKNAPYEVSVMPAGASLLRGGEVKRRVAMARYSKAKATGIFPGYGYEATAVEAPQFAEYLYEKLEQEIEQ